ncbi:protein takeout-like [Rhodnius prolixus]|uniref:protein takeout-like n=1 Tax=Rhodnius prolixus TaxID=13249 RepID=UPI003D18B7CD
MLSVIYFAIIFLLPSSYYGAKLPTTFHRCTRTDPLFDTCLNNAVEDAIKKLANGIPKLGLLALEPLSITQLSIGKGRGPISLDLTFKNLKIHGVTNVKIMDQKTNLKEIRLECRSVNKKLVLEGDYETDGKILLLPIRGKGKAHIVLDNVDGYSIITGETKTKRSKQFLEVKKYDYKFQPSKMTLQLDNLFNGEKALSDGMNKILNDNWEEVLKELKPSFEEALSEIFKEITNRLYQKVSLDEIYPENE